MLKIRTIIVGSVTTVALAVPGVASAALPVHKPGAVTPPHVVQPTREVGSAGIEGWDDKACEEIDNDYQVAMEKAADAAASNDDAMRAAYVAVAIQANDELENNCLIVE
jgi:hypothetical protein